jgi:hypothetical protein
VNLPRNHAYTRPAPIGAGIVGPSLSPAESGKRRIQFSRNQPVTGYSGESFQTRSPILEVIRTYNHHVGDMGSPGCSWITPKPEVDHY